MQTDPIGYEDQFNLYAYVGNDPINGVDPSGTTCTKDKDEMYSCQIDFVAVVGKDGKLTGEQRAPTKNETKQFREFNKRYTDAVNKLAQSPDSKVTVAADDGRGSFETTAGEAIASLVSREFTFVKTIEGGLATNGRYDPSTGSVVGAKTYVFGELGLTTPDYGIVHDGGFHATPQEFYGGLQTPDLPLGKIPHQEGYNKAACILLGKTCG